MSNDKLYVRTSALRAALEPWLAAQRKRYIGHNRGGIRVVDYLQREAGVSRTAIESVLYGKTDKTTLAVADRLLSTIERPDLLQTDPSLEVIRGTRRPA